MSFILDPGSFCAVLWTTIGSGHSMPSTHPSGTRLARCWVRHLSIWSFGESFSNSNGVNPASADRVDMSRSEFSFLFKGMTSPRGWPTGIVGYGGLLANYHLGHLSCTRAHHSRLGILPHILLRSTGLSLSFSLETHQLSSTLCLQASVELCS